MLQLAMSASAAFNNTATATDSASNAASTTTVLSSVPAHVCALLVCVLEHRVSLILPDCSSLVVALIRHAIHALNAPLLPRVAVQRTALALTRLLTRLPDIGVNRTSHSPAGSGNSGRGSPLLLSAVTPALLLDYLHACKQCVDADRGQAWQSIVQPAVAALLSLMSEHDLTATHLMLPSAERELFKPIIAHYKRELRYRGQ